MQLAITEHPISCYVCVYFILVYYSSTLFVNIVMNTCSNRYMCMRVIMRLCAPMRVPVRSRACARLRVCVCLLVDNLPVKCDEVEVSLKQRWRFKRHDLPI